MGWRRHRMRMSHLWTGQTALVLFWTVWMAVDSYWLFSHSILYFVYYTSITIRCTPFSPSYFPVASTLLSLFFSFLPTWLFWRPYTILPSPDIACLDKVKEGDYKCPRRDRWGERKKKETIVWAHPGSMTGERTAPTCNWGRQNREKNVYFTPLSFTFLLLAPYLFCLLLLHLLFFPILQLLCFSATISSLNLHTSIHFFLLAFSSCFIFCVL